ncbi:hypothetical protein K6K41_14490 [Chenggangzhangella methanolivorans]|uniref:Uncharacterized protein n=1 Tax=Chenggangzhangella methanolivorans TaxID=1437009 RepID=A0A9E6UN82_9HYPH|nr:hypothetical protein K6K41_14490 [Chenggangzhangella methanolivorans]
MKARLSGSTPALDIDALEQAELGLGRGQRHADGAAVGVHAGTRDHQAHRTARGARDVGALKHHRDAALGAHIAVAGGVEGVAAAARRQHRGLRERDEREGAGEDRNAHHHGALDAPRAERRDGLVEGDERRRTGGVDGEARTVQIVNVRNTI